MKVFRRIASMLCCLVLMLSLCLTAAAAEDSTRGLIQQALNYYYHYQSAGKTDVYRLLAQISELDPETGALWTNIFDFWYYALEELPKNETQLPDGLPEDDSLCIVVLGYQLESNGSMRPELIGRLELALAAAEKYPNAQVICTGGGTASKAKGTTEAGQMAKWLKNNGIDADRITAETKSYSTLDNANYVLSILSQDMTQVSQIVLVTSDYHLTRSCALFNAVAQRTAQANGTEAVQIVYCLGYEAGHEGYAEDPLDQTAQVARIMGFSFEQSEAPTLSMLENLTVSGETVLEVGQIPELTVTAVYDSGFTWDVTEICTFSEFDPDSPYTQQIRISYQENGRLISTSVEITRPVEETEPETQAPTVQVEETAPLMAAQAPETEEPADSKPPFWVLPALAGAIILLLVLILLLARPKKKGRRKRRR